MKLPTDPCRWCGHQRRQHGNWVSGCRVSCPTDDHTPTACPCARFRPFRRWGRKVKV